jgi:hypothetical protein
MMVRGCRHRDGGAFAPSCSPPIKPTSLVDTCAGVGVLGEVAEKFDLVLDLGTKSFTCACQIGTIPIVGIAESNPIYQVLLCQTFQNSGRDGDSWEDTLHAPTLEQ